MSIASFSNPMSRVQPIRSIAAADSARLNWVEKGLLFAGIFEVPLQLDKYFGMRDADANLGAVAGLNVSVTLLAFLGLYALWLLGAAGRRLTPLASLTLGIPMVIYLGLLAISTLSAKVSFLAICDTFNVLQAYLLFFYLANRIRLRSDIIFVIGCLGGAMLFQGLLVIGLAALGEGAAGQDFFLGPIVLSVWSDGRPAGSMHSAVLAGSVLSMVWLPIAGLNLSQCSLWVKRGSAVVLAVVLLAILLTQTRGAILTTGLGSIAFGLAMLRRGWLSRKVIIASLVLAMMASLPLANVVRKRVLADDNDSAGARKHLTAIALDTIEHRPLFGYGAGNCHLACMSSANASQYRAEWYYTIHCKYLVVWIETGIFGLIAFLCVMGNGIRQGFSAWMTRDRLLAPIGITLSLAIMGHMTHMLVDIFNSRSQTQILWIMLGLTAAVCRIAKESKPAPPEPMVSRAMMMGANPHA